MMWWDMVWTWPTGHDTEATYCLCWMDQLCEEAMLLLVLLLKYEIE